MGVIRLAQGVFALFYLLPFMFIASFFRSALRPLCLIGFILSAVVASAQNPTAADGFDPNVDGNVYAMVTQPDGKIIVAGQFSLFRPAIGAPVTRRNIARINPDGTVDSSFNPNVGTLPLNADGSPDLRITDRNTVTATNAPVRAVILQPDGKILIGGDFTGVQPNEIGTAAIRNRIARLNTDGSVDASFNPNITALTVAEVSANPFLLLTDAVVPQVNAIAVQPNGKVVVGGRFTLVRSNVIVRHLARFNADGSTDTAYFPNPNNAVNALAVQLTPADFTGPNRTPTGDGRIIVGGGFRTFETRNALGVAEFTTRNRIARINGNGVVDSEFDGNANDVVNALAIQRDGKIVLGGSFTTLQPIGNNEPTARNHLARLNPNGTLDSEFIPQVGGNVVAVAIAPDGGLMVGGSFTSVWSLGSATTTRAYVARFAPNGTVDTSFNASANFTVAAFGFQPDGKIVLGGYFTGFTSRGAGTAIARNHLARVNADGTLDATLVIGIEGRPFVTLELPGGKLLIGGSFTSVGGVTRSALARLNADGTVDPTFVPPAINGRILALARQPSDNKIFIGGTFSLVGTVARNYLARLNADGSLDTSYDPNPNGQVGTIIVQSDEKILVAGSFNIFQTNKAGDVIVRGYLARVNKDGSLDTFNPSPNSTVSSVAVMSDGRLVLGGAFTAFTPNGGTGTTTQNYIARIKTDGTVDTTFIPILNGRVTTVVLQGDKVIAGGQFTAFTPKGATDPSTENITRNRMIRFNSDGTLDTTFEPNVISGTVLNVVLQPDNKLLIGGTFLGVQSKADTTWTLTKYIARLNADGSVDKTFNLDLSEATGNRVDSILLQSSGSIIIGGAFTSIHPIGDKKSDSVLAAGDPDPKLAPVPVNQYVRVTSRGLLDTTFTPGIGGASDIKISSFAVQNDNKIVAVGQFTDIGGTRTTNIARFHAEGTADKVFSSSLDAAGPVNAVMHRPDTAPITTQGNGLAWLNTDGSLRTSFAPSVKFTGQINVVTVQADGKILLGGTFIDPDNGAVKNMVRLLPNGQLDNFYPSPDGAVTSIVVQADGKILVGGSFTGIVGQTRNYIARLNIDGTLDTGFNPTPDNRVNAIAIQPSDNKIVFGGTFTTVKPNGATDTTARAYIARVNADGTLDTGYNPGANALVNALLIEPDGKMIAGGNFTQFTPNAGSTTTVRNYIARLNTDGTVDTNYDPAATGAVHALARYVDGKLIVGGEFTSFSPNSATATTVITTVRNHIARLNTDGSVDSNFDPNPNGTVNSVVVQSDGAVVYGGVFTAVQSNGAAEAVVRNYLARANFDGSLDVGFNPESDGAIYVVATGSTVAPNGTRVDGGLILGGAITTVRPNGVMIVGGNFPTIGGAPSRNLALVNDDGTVSSTFQPNPNGAVNALLSLPDGNLLVAGDFTSLSGVTRNRVARFGGDNTLDTGFAPNVNGAVNAVANVGNGRVLVGGSFSAVNGTSRTNLARLLPDGSTDSAFTASVGVVRALAVQGDGRILVLVDGSGVRSNILRLNADGSTDSTFTAFNGGSAVINSIALQSDGRILVGGAFTGFLRRLNSNGTLDTTFDAQVDGTVTAVALQTDGRVLLGGSFNRVSGLPRNGIARLSATTPATQRFTISAPGTAVTWSRGGTGVELSSVTFDRSDDHLNWTRIGSATRAANGDWTITVAAQPATTSFYIRARGVLQSGGVSSGLTETIREFNRANVMVDDVNIATPVPGVVQPGTPGGPNVPPVSAPVAGFRVLADLTSLSEAVANAQLATTPGTGNLAHLANLSTRARVAADNALLTGFAINGTGERTVLIRAVGPGLNAFGVSGTLSAPLLRLYDAVGNVLVENKGWSNSTALAQAGAMSGAFPLGANSADSALLVTLAPGTYSLQVSDGNGAAGGVALAEIYDVAGGSNSRLANVSSRTSTGAADGLLISGFVIAGTQTDNYLLIRGVGPSLTQFGVTGAISDPKIGVYNAAGTMVASNDNWSSGTDAATISAQATSVGAFALSLGTTDAALAVKLGAGAYTAQVSAATGSAGTALLEIYELK